MQVTSQLGFPQFRHSRRRRNCSNRFWKFHSLFYFAVILATKQGIDTQLYILILEDLVHSFNFCYQDFGHYRQQMQVYATPFAVPMDWVSPDYQLKLIDLQSSDTKRDTFWYTTLLAFNKYLFQQQTFIVLLTFSASLLWPLCIMLNTYWTPLLEVTFGSSTKVLEEAL